MAKKHLTQISFSQQNRTLCYRKILAFLSISPPYKPSIKWIATHATLNYDILQINKSMMNFKHTTRPGCNNLMQHDREKESVKSRIKKGGEIITDEGIDARWFLVTNIRNSEELRRLSRTIRRLSIFIGSVCASSDVRACDRLNSPVARTFAEANNTANP